MSFQAEKYDSLETTFKQHKFSVHYKYRLFRRFQWEGMVLLVNSSLSVCLVSALNVEATITFLFALFLFFLQKYFSVRVAINIPTHNVNVYQIKYRAFSSFVVIY